MEDMAAIVLYGYDGDHMERYTSVESNPDHYELVEKKPHLDRYQMGCFDSSRRKSEFQDVSSPDNSYCECVPVEEMKKVKIESENRVEVLSATIVDEYTKELFDTKKLVDTTELVDTTDALTLKLHPEKLKPTNKKRLLDLASMLTECKYKRTIYTFSPGQDGLNWDGDRMRVYESSVLSDLKLLDRFSTTVCKVIKQYNDTVPNEHSDSKLEFVSFIRAVSMNLGKGLFITFKARQKGNGKIGTYQAGLLDEFCHYELQLVLLRHVEADKIVAILSLAGAAEEVKKVFSGFWS